MRPEQPGIEQAERRWREQCLAALNRRFDAGDIMNWRGVTVFAIWAYLLFDAYHQGLALPGMVTELSVPALPMSLMAFVLAVLLPASAWMTFSQRRRLIEDMPLITPFIDRRFGEGTYRDLNRSFRPVAISIAVGLILSISGMRATYTSTGDASAYFLSVVFLAVALGLLAAYLLSRLYPPHLH